MNDQRLEHEIRAIFDEAAPPMPPDKLLYDFEQQAKSTRRRPRWLAHSTEPTMYYDSRLAVGSPTVRLVSIMAATLMLLLALVAVAAGIHRVLQDEITVDASGKGDYTTIREALEAAEDGNTILVMPGTYNEYLDITKDVSITGVGGPDEVLVEYTHDGQDGAIWGYGVRLEDVEAEIRNVAFSGPAVANGTTIVADGGSLTLENVVVHPGPNSLETSGDGMMRGVELHGATRIGRGSDFTVVDSLLWCEVHPGDGTFIDTAFLYEEAKCPEMEPDCCAQADPTGLTPGIWIEAASPSFTGSTFELAMEVNGIPVSTEEDPPPPGARPVIEKSTFTGLDTAITLLDSATAQIRDNVFAGNGTSISVGRSNAIIEDNTVNGGQTAFVLTSVKPELTGNTVDGVTGPAVSITGAAAPILRDNVLCADGRVLDIADTATPDIDDSNEICDGSAERLVVDASGGGDFTTIREALEAAEDGNAILVMPGTYSGWFDVTKNVTISGAGDRNDVVLEYGHDGQAIAESLGPEGVAVGRETYGFRFMGVEAALSNVEIRGPNGLSTALEVDGGRLDLENVVVRPGPEALNTSGGGVLRGVELHGPTRIHGDGYLTVEDSELWCFVQVANSNTAFTRTTFRYDADPCPRDPSRLGRHTAAPNGNRLPDESGSAVMIEASAPTFIDNTFELPMMIFGLVVPIEFEDPASEPEKSWRLDPPDGVENPDRIGAEPLIEANTFRGLETAITVRQTARPRIRDNAFVENDVAIEVGPALAIIESNTVSGGQTGFILTAAKPELISNTVEGVSGPAVSIEGAAAPILRDNVLCAEGTVVEIADTATPDIDDSNEICA